MLQRKNHKHYFLCIAECIIERGDKILMITRPEGGPGGGLLGFPGGKVDQEDGARDQHVFEQAARREVLEEVGIQLADPLRLVTSRFFKGSIKQCPIIDCIFHCVAVKTDCTVYPSPREVPHYQWLTREEILVHPKAPPSVKRLIRML